MATVAARFWAKVRKTDTCWLLTGKHHVTSGYGQFWRAAGDTQDAIAADHGVSQAVVSQIVRRVTWTHVA